MAAMNVIGPKASPPALASANFVDETKSSGLAHTYEGGSEFDVGGGVAVFDCNGDGRPDLYLAGGANRAGLYRNNSQVGGTLQFTKLDSSAADLADVNGPFGPRADGAAR